MDGLDFTVILDYVLGTAGEILVPVLSIFAAWLAKRFLNIKLDADARNAIQGALGRAVDFGVAQAGIRLQGKVGDVHIKNAIISRGAQYLLESFPDAVKHLNVTGTQLAHMVEARLTERLLTPDDPLVDEPLE